MSLLSHKYNIINRFTFVGHGWWFMLSSDSIYSWRNPPTFNTPCVSWNAFAKAETRKSYEFSTRVNAPKYKRYQACILRLERSWDADIWRAILLFLRLIVRIRLSAATTAWSSVLRMLITGVAKWGWKLWVFWSVVGEISRSDTRVQRLAWLVISLAE